MSHLKSGIGVALTAFLTCVAMGVSASGALAAGPFTLSVEKCEGGTFINACWAATAGGELKELVGENEFLGELEEGNVVFKSEIGGEKITIECSSVTADGLVLQAKPLSENATIEVPVTTGLVFKTCKLTSGATKCSVKEEEPLLAATGTFSSAEDVTFKPKTGENFIEIEFKNKGSEKCPATILGKHAVKGEQLCLFAEVTNQVEERLLTCEESGSKLKFGAENATATVKFMLKVKLDELGDLWDISSVT